MTQGQKGDIEKEDESVYEKVTDGRAQEELIEGCVPYYEIFEVNHVFTRALILE